MEIYILDQPLILCFAQWINNILKIVSMKQLKEKEIF